MCTRKGKSLQVKQRTIKLFLLVSVRFFTYYDYRLRYSSIYARIIVRLFCYGRGELPALLFRN
jgi:hypothetical protein